MADDLIRYSVLQLDLQPLDPEKLLKAFRAVPQLVSLDARSIARDAFGILVEDLPAEDARRLRAALAAEGIETQVVAMQSLLRLPLARPLTKAAVTEDALIVFDLADREKRLSWEWVAMIAAGNVKGSDFQRSEFGAPTGSGTLHMTGGASSKEKEVQKPVAELILTVEPGRYRIDAFQFNYEYLRPSPTSGAVNNFKAVVADLTKHAPTALLNHGARTLKHDPRQLVDYPSRHAFEEEMVWLIWKSGASA